MLWNSGLIWDIFCRHSFLSYSSTLTKLVIVEDMLCGFLGTCTRWICVCSIQSDITTVGHLACACFTFISCEHFVLLHFFLPNSQSQTILFIWSAFPPESTCKAKTFHETVDKTIAYINPWEVPLLGIDIHIPFCIVLYFSLEGSLSVL